MHSLKDIISWTFIGLFSFSDIFLLKNLTNSSNNKLFSSNNAFNTSLGLYTFTAFTIEYTKEL